MAITIQLQRTGTASRSAVRARCTFLPDLECGGWMEGHWGLLLFGALVWAAVSHLAVAIEWSLCEEKYLHDVAHRGPRTAPAADTGCSPT